MSKRTLSPCFSSRLLDELGHQGCPPSLVAGPKPSPTVPMHVLIEGHRVLPPGVLAEQLHAAVHGSAIQSQDKTCKPHAHGPGERRANANQSRALANKRPSGSIIAGIGRYLSPLEGDVRNRSMRRTDSCWATCVASIKQTRAPTMVDPEGHTRAH